jgi:hypothetical protein
MTEGILNSFLLRVVPPLFALLMRLWFCSCRGTVHNFANLLNEEGEVRQIVASFWDYSIIYELVKRSFEAQDGRVQVAS